MGLSEANAAPLWMITFCKGYMGKIKLFRKGRYVGIVKENFHNTKTIQPETNIWSNLGINNFEL